MSTPQELAAKYAVITDIQERRRVFFEDMVAFYNKGNLGYNPVNRRCHYYPSKTSPGCAIGRCLSNPSALPHAGVTSDEVFNNLPTWMQEMDRIFLSAIQAFHDWKPNWNAAGLSEVGKAKYNIIKSQFNL